MATFVCVRKCIFRNRRFRVGEKLNPREGEEVTKHFVPEADFSKDAIPEEPRTIKEMQDRQLAAKKQKTGMKAKPKKPKGGVKSKNKSKKKDAPEDPFE